jgi:hypothetical protein
METTMNARQLWIFGLTALGMVLAAPVQAAPGFMDGAFIVAKRDRAEEVRQDQHDTRDMRQDERRAPKSNANRDEPQGYGYGYERRQQKQFEEDNRTRGRR